MRLIFLRHGRLNPFLSLSLSPLLDRSYPPDPLFVPAMVAGSRTACANFSFSRSLTIHRAAGAFFRVSPLQHAEAHANSLSERF